MVTEASRPPTASEARILAAARGLVRDRGPEKLTMSAVAAAAGVSRPTLYRWFPTKALLFGAMAAAAVEDFDAGLRALVRRHDDPSARLDAALRYLVTYMDATMGADAVRVDAAFALQGLADSLPPHVESLTRELGDALDEVPAVSTGSASRRQAAELFLRVAYSQYLVPDGEPERVLAIVRAVAGLDDRVRTGRAGGGRRGRAAARR